MAFVCDQKQCLARSRRADSFCGWLFFFPHPQRKSPKASAAPHPPAGTFSPYSDGEKEALSEPDR
ncbi:hypothetical protein EN824_12705 [Mesorhizobium sp. M8A.F.Ca.ET.181.01.1.1]|nr:hypothetical protein EOA36_22330 [Mesorhizobium sp. M8A.F.Ca.ET.021.01.1.1]TGS44639.1 hypothetical protein EN825_12470 [Mesorhizobium sp. M8A.F.Ca.ET.182.01.1.1]TGS80338.1 hypothetical protein EN824_12705 [Mesorhizobium sp. M8A.F.Ca.ET.181.01.1.1]